MREVGSKRVRDRESAGPGECNVQDRVIEMGYSGALAWASWGFFLLSLFLHFLIFSESGRFWIKTCVELMNMVVP